MNRALPLTGLVVVVLVAGTAAGALAIAPKLQTLARPLTWSASLVPTPDDGQKLGRFIVGSIGEYHSRVPVVTDGARSLELTLLEGHDVLGVYESSVALVVALELAVEGPGPAVELLISTDAGETWTQRTLPKPSYLARLEEVVVRWPSVAITLSLDEPADIAPEWRRWPWRWVEAAAGRRISASRGAWRAASTDGAVTFRLSGPH